MLSDPLVFWGGVLKEPLAHSPPLRRLRRIDSAPRAPRTPSLQLLGLGAFGTSNPLPHHSPRPSTISSGSASAPEFYSVKKSEIWSRFSIPVAYEALWFRFGALCLCL